MTREKTGANTQPEIPENLKVFIDNEEESPSFAWPTVVAVIVTHNPGDWLEGCLTSMAAQEYPDLTTLVVDVCSDTDLSERVAQSMPTAFVRRSETDINFAQAVNEAVDSIEGATYVLICHDDIVIENGAIAEMVEEAFRSNASIVGPKITDAAQAGRLLEVGGMIDRFGVPFSGIEPDEVDQGQHDGVRDVFFVSSATMLVRADLFRALGGFDVQCFPGAEDIDLAWRAHLVGARVLVQPEAIVRHHKTSDRERKARTSATAIVARHRMRAVLKNASPISLAWILPAAFVLHSVEGIVWLLRADPRRAWLLFSGWIWNIRHLKDTRRERAKIQKSREVSDRVISAHQIGGSARIRRFFTSIIENRQLKKLTEASRTFATARYSRRTRETPIYLSAMAVYLITVRSIIFNGVNHIGGFVRWPSFTQQVNALFHGGLPASHEPMLSSTFGRLIALALTFICGTHAGLAQTVLVLALIPIGGYGVRLLLKERAIGPRSVALAAVTYGAFGLGMHSFSSGDFGSIVMLAGLPYFLRALSNRRTRQVGVVAAIMLAFYSPAIVVCCVLGFAFIAVGEKSDVGNPLLVPSRDIARRVRTVAFAAIIALATNCGLVVDSLRNIDRNTFGLSDTSHIFHNYLFPNLSVTLAIYLAVFVSVCALIVGRNERTGDIRVLVIGASALILFSYVAFHFAQPIYQASAIYCVIQLAAALSLGVCMHSYADEMKLRAFGLFHFATTLAIIAIAGSVLLSIPVVRNGTFGLPGRSWSNQIDSVHDEKILYIGDSRVLPGRSVLAPFERSFSVAEQKGATSSYSFVGPASSLDSDIRNIYSSVVAQDTTHAGLLLARLGIGSVVVPTSRAPDSAKVASDPQLLHVLDRQTDLVRLEDRDGLVAYQNEAFTRGYPLTDTARSLTPAQVYKLKNQNSPTIFAHTDSPVQPITTASIALCVMCIVLVILWPRRHKLLSTRSLLLTRIVSTSHKNNSEPTSDLSQSHVMGTKHDESEIDLEKEHSLDQSEIHNEISLTDDQEPAEDTTEIVQ